MSDLKLQARLPLNCMTQSPIINGVLDFYWLGWTRQLKFIGCLTVQLQNNICNRTGQIRQFEPEKRIKT